MHAVNVSELAAGEGSRSVNLEGEQLGGVDLTIIFVDLDPGRGPRLHRHDYPEVFVIQEGRAGQEAGDERPDAGPGDVIAVPAGVPHRIESTGDVSLRQLSLHLAPAIVTEWLEDET